MFKSDLSGEKILLTGHTGFKGSWLTIWLNQMGVEVHGLALDPIEGGLYSAANLSTMVSSDHRVDIRNLNEVSRVVNEVNPTVVIHMAAQPLVRQSYVEPIETFETNILGTANVLRESINNSNVKAILSITTDKVYKNLEQLKGYSEEDALGGNDPYSASKACAEIVSHSLFFSYERIGLTSATARAGNVIGGGDVSPDRLLPDLFRKFSDREVAEIRNKNAVRPWQHVLDPLNGYLHLVANLIKGKGEGAWNFGPDPDDILNVGDVANEVHSQWPNSPGWKTDDSGNHPHEAGLLVLDSAKAYTELGWKTQLAAKDAIQWTVEWELQKLAGKSPLEICNQQINKFESLSN